MEINAERHYENLAKVTILIWRLTYSMCIFGWQLKRYLNLTQDLQMSRFISLCSLWNDGIMVGEMTVVSIMHKVRVWGRHLCKWSSPHGWQRNKWKCSFQSGSFRYVPASLAPEKSVAIVKDSWYLKTDKKKRFNCGLCENMQHNDSIILSFLWGYVIFSHKTDKCV